MRLNLLLGGLLCTAFSVGATAQSLFRTQPFLQNPTNGGITVSWITHKPVNSWVEYGTDTTQQLNKARTLVDGQAVCYNTQHKIRLTDLTPGKTYYYRVVSQEMLEYKAYSKKFGVSDTSKFYAFKLPSTTTSNVTAVILNDLHKNHALIDEMSKTLDKMHYDMVFFNGDCIDDPANEEQALNSLNYFINAFKGYEKPMFFIRGNHEIRNAYSIKMRDLFDYVDNSTYNAFSWGDTRFVTLDCGEDKPDDHWVYYGLNDFTQLRHDQQRFLEKELKGAAYKKAEKRILLHHIPIYTKEEMTYNPCLELWHPLLNKSKFNICVNAHTHRYAWYPKNAENGFPFPVVTGGGPQPKNATIIVLNKNSKDLTLQVIDCNGNVINTVNNL
ncbi:MAG: metallophosphoesterase [Marinifilaceae bacterium]